jgi:hypothetical protein
MNLNDVIEQYGGLVPIIVESDHCGKVTIGLNYLEFLDFLMEQNYGCIYTEKGKLSLFKTHNDYIQ